jgi:peptidoglycan biosynthesis protein MviN/MurJ (putative lipid II flippase)
MIEVRPLKRFCAMPQEARRSSFLVALARLNTLQNVQGTLAFRQGDVPVFIERAAKDTSKYFENIRG